MVLGELWLGMLPSCFLVSVAVCLQSTNIGEDDTVPMFPDVWSSNIGEDNTDTITSQLYQTCSDNESGEKFGRVWIVYICIASYHHDYLLVTAAVGVWYRPFREHIKLFVKINF